MDDFQKPRAQFDRDFAKAKQLHSIFFKIILGLMLITATAVGSVALVTILHPEMIGHFFAQIVLGFTETVR